MQTDLAHFPVRYDDEHSREIHHGKQCNTPECIKNGNQIPIRIRQRRDKGTRPRQYEQDAEDPDTDIDAASPAGHIFAMICHVNNACSQESQGHTSSNIPTHIQET